MEGRVVKEREIVLYCSTNVKKLIGILGLLVLKLFLILGPLLICTFFFVILGTLGTPCKLWNSLF